MDKNAASGRLPPSLLLFERAFTPSRRRQQLLLVYVLLVAWIAALVLARSGPALLAARREDLVLLAAIAAVAPSIFVLLSPQSGGHIPIAFALLVTAIFLFEPGAAALLAGIAGAAASLTAGLRQPLRLAFSTANCVVSAFLAAKVFEIAGGVPGDVISRPLPAISAILVALAALAALRTCALVFGSPVRTAEMSPEEGLRRLPIYLAMSGFGLGLSVIYQAVGAVGLLVFLVPSAIAGHSFRQYVAKGEEVHAKNAALEQFVGELEAINQVSSHFASMHTLEHTLQLAALAATKLADFQFAFVLAYDEAEDSFLPGAVSGLAPELFAQVSGPLCTELAPVIAGHSGPVVITAERYAMCMKALRSLGLATASLTLLPITRSDQRIGLLGVGSNEVPSDDRLRFLEILAAQTGLALDHAGLYLRMKQLAVSDYVTGLHNHRFFQESLEAEVAHCSATGRALALMMLDIDGFKEFNDRHGHPAGDRLLRQIGARIKSGLRRGDLVCRYGGDEFAVILPDTDTAQAIAVAERIRQAVASNPSAADDAGGAVVPAALTVSIGIALLAPDCVTKQGLLGRADLALYRAKVAGRNTVSLHDSARGPACAAS